jgi:peptidoglycan-associated lipoprotein
MKNRVWIHLVMAVLVAGLFLTVSCAKKTVVSDATTIEDQGTTGTVTDTGASKTGTDTGTDTNADAEAIAQQKLDDQAANEKALKEARTVAARKRFENQDIHFEFDSSDLSSMAKMILKEKAVWLQANYSEAITIEGHCDERGTTEYNLALGERRAGVAKAYLTNLGVSATRLNTFSYGEEQPLDSAQTEEAYRKNRRAHFAIE